MVVYMAEICWIRLRIDMFDDEKIKIIQSMPEGDAILVIWIRLLALAGKCNADGLVLVEDEFPYSDEMLSVIFNKPLTTVRLALKTFEKFKMIENTTKGIYISNFNKHQNIEGLERIREQNRLRKQRERERKKALLAEIGKTPALPGPEQPPGDIVPDVSRDKSREVTQQKKEEEKDIYNISSYEDIVGETPTAAEHEPEDKERIIYQKIMDDYHSTCPSLPGLRAITEGRRRKIRILTNEFDKLKVLPGMSVYDRLHEIFRLAAESDFLSGRNGRWDGCSFDWLINKTNALKVLEGNYSNKGGAGNGANRHTSSNENDTRTDGTTSEALERFRRNRGAGV